MIEKFWFKFLNTFFPLQESRKLGMFWIDNEFEKHCLTGPSNWAMAPFMRPDPVWSVNGHVCHSPEEFRKRARMTKEDATAFFLKVPFYGTP